MDTVFSLVSVCIIKIEPTPPPREKVCWLMGDSDIPISFSSKKTKRDRS